MSGKQQITGKYVAILGNIIFIPCMPAHLCSYKYMSVLSKEGGTYNHFSLWFDLNGD